MDEPENPEVAATGWARLPAWQHVVLIVLCSFGVIAGIANFLVSDSYKARALHAIFTVVVGALLITLISAYLARRRP